MKCYSLMRAWRARSALLWKVFAGLISPSISPNATLRGNSIAYSNIVGTCGLTSKNVGHTGIQLIDRLEDRIAHSTLENIGPDELNRHTAGSTAWGASARERRHIAGQCICAGPEAFRRKAFVYILFSVSLREKEVTSRSSGGE
ncbi:uncharacterized protein LOC109399617 [Aedes albopictus]|uniref:Secreted protein n=1 Tax=Aedes albopictus TaxID=7160 RepID=A0ABM1YS07_AEDAL